MLLSTTVLAIYNLIASRPFSVARPARDIKGCSSPRCAPLRALAWGYDCVALRAMPLRDGIPLPYGGNICWMQSFAKLSMANTVVVRKKMFRKEVDHAFQAKRVQ
jgi:hypothetical protein